MAIQSHLFRSLEDHAPFAVIGWSIWLALLQNIFFLVVKIKRWKKNLNLSKKIYFSDSRKPPYIKPLQLVQFHIIIYLLSHLYFGLIFHFNLAMAIFEQLKNDLIQLALWATK